MYRRLIGSIAAAALAALMVPTLGVTAAEAADDPPPVSPGSVFYDDFTSGMTSWKAITGDLGAWEVSDDAHPVVTIDTTDQSSGDYIRPAEALALPDKYQLTATVRIDEAPSDATVSLLFDMSEPDNIKGQDMAVQFGAVDANGNASVKLVSPLAVNRLCSGTSPLTKGDWHTVTVKRAGGITSAWVDGQLVASVESIESGGTIGIGSYHSVFSIGSISVDALDSVPDDQPATAEGCSWSPPVTPPDEGTGSGTVSGDGTWAEAAPVGGDAPGHEVSAGEATISLDGTWQFVTDPNGTGEDRGFPDPTTDTSSWSSLTVPGNWDVHDAYGTYRGVGWYKRTFQTGDLSAEAHQHAILRFGAVYWDTTVWLNGKRLGSHAGGYTPFEFDVSKYLVDGENTLVVAADNTYHRPAWWPWGGISRDVTLIRTGDVVMDHQEVVAKPDLSAGTATVTSTVTVRNWSDEDAEVSVSGRVTDTALDATVKSAGSQRVAVPAGGTADVVLTAELGAGTYELWGLDDPNLYRFETTVDSGARGAETVSDRFGIRSIVIDGTSMLLNGQKLKLAGANRVADDPINGNVEPVALVRRDLDRMKAAGMNMMRIMHYPQAPDLLDYADEIGMLIISAQAVQRGTQQDDPKTLITDIPRVQRETREAVNRDFNHPSIFAYSVGNEIASNTPSGIEYDRTMADFIHAVDPSRYVTQVSSKIGSITSGDQDGSQFMDFVSINMYGGFAGAVDHAHKMYPDVPIFVSEYSPDGYTFGTDRQTLDFTTGSGSVSNAFRSRDFVMGWSQWTFNDYRSDFRGSSPDMVRGWGDRDVWGRLKKSYDSMLVANAPIDSLTLTDVSRSTDGGVAIATITPRGTADSDGPVYLLSGYRLVLRVTDAHGSVVGGSITPLADIAPGDPKRTLPVVWSGDGTGVTAQLTLLSPTGYEVDRTSVALAVPAEPTITSTVAASTSLRVRFSDPADTRNYRVQAVDASGKVVSTVTTAERFADLTGLSKNTSYTVRVAAVNDAGASDPATATLSTTGGLAMAPKLDALVPVQNGLVLGYSDNTAGATFEVRVADVDSGDQVQDYTTTNRPGTRVENLTPKHAYDVSIRRLNGDGNAATVWSEPMRGKPLGEHTKPTLVVDGVVAGPSSVGIVIRPQDGVERYSVEVHGRNGARSFNVERAAVNLLPITGLEPSSHYQVTVSAQSATGSSAAWRGVVATAAAQNAVVAPTNVAFEKRGGDVYLTWDRPHGKHPDGYIVTRSVCGVITTMLSSTTELKFEDLESGGGEYTVSAFRSGTVSVPSEAVTAPGEEACTYVVTPDDTAARDDGSVPFTTSGGWHMSGVLGAGGYPSLYIKADAQPEPSATWTAPDVGDVRYKVEVSIPDGVSVTSAHYTLHTPDGDKVITVNQDENRKSWVELGEYGFSSKVPGNVTLSDGSGGVYLRASAVRFTPVSSS